jgi:hypothetical protein
MGTASGGVAIERPDVTRIQRGARVHGGRAPTLGALAGQDGDAAGAEGREAKAVGTHGPRSARRDAAVASETAGG